MKYLRTKRKMNSSEFKIFVDFDGTITKSDIGEELFIEFGNKDFAKALIEDWNQGKVESCKGWSSLCENVEVIDIEKLKAFLYSAKIDEAFHRFVDYSKENGFDVKIISDGFDYYIRTILEKENLGHLTYSSNVLEINDDNRLVPSFPYSVEDCKCCANCKRNFVIDNSSDEDFTVYIGDGHSDKCPVQYCDFIFAKNSLLKFCEVNRITYFPYSNFDDVIKKLEELRSKKRLKKRHQAELKRREIYSQG